MLLVDRRPPLTSKSSQCRGDNAAFCVHYRSSDLTFHTVNSVTMSLPICYMFTGVFRGGHQVLVRAKLALGDGVTMQLTVRSTEPQIAELILSTVG